MSPKPSRSAGLSTIVKSLGTMRRPLTSTERWSSISRTRRRPSSIGRIEPWERRVNTPSTIRSRRRSIDCNPMVDREASGRFPPRPVARSFRSRELLAHPRAQEVHENADECESGDRGDTALAFRSPLCASGGMADASASGAGVRKGVGVQVPPRAREIPCCAGGFPRGHPPPPWTARRSSLHGRLSTIRAG